MYGFEHNFGSTKGLRAKRDIFIVDVLIYTRAFVFHNQRVVEIIYVTFNYFNI